MFRGILILCLAFYCYARPSEESVNTKNVITVPPNCPPGQQLINDVCRDVWRFNENIDANLDLDPPKCASGELTINGRCFKILRTDTKAPKEVVTVPPNCPSGQEFINGQCREIWRALSSSLSEEDSVVSKDRLKRQSEGTITAAGDRKVINVPNQCPSGYRPDSQGVCREVFE